ncbi:HAD family hydrolase [Gracilibacillus lacisalsi]|uniref:HAD family hydrolase n=1 Tax=Gracilibacillus lacisalsi TaxID=393087 RepID=UPI0003792520|nr:HAD family hydrolase [Gracilibacillus lacisalsi]
MIKTMNESTAETFSTINTILFDLDGTLLDSRETLVKAAYQTVQEFNPNTITYEELMRHFGSDFSLYLTKLLPKQHEVKSFFIKEKAKYYHTLSLFPNVLEGLKRLHGKKFQLGLVTNQQKELVEQVLKENGIDEYFSIVITRNDVKRSKPSPEPILQAIKKFRSNRQEVLMVGDTEYDYLAAKRAGIPCVLLNYYESKEEANGIFNKLVEQLISGGEAYAKQ